MSECWGLDLSTSAVRLMRRDGGHWREIASEPLGEPDMDARLQALAAQADAADAVDIFLPRDQILYTDVKLTGKAAASAEIDTAMEGRTPYALDDLEIDWETDEDGTARVAAIARETLDEAEVFAAQLGVTVAHFSALAEPDDFPRMPDFGLGKGALSSPEAPETAGPVAFASQRTDDPEGTQAEATPKEPRSPDTPVVRVDDPEPVMQVVTEKPEPLDPGPALPRAEATPRVRTDMALPAEGGTAAASLAPGDEKYGRDPLPVSERRRILGYGLAAVLTIAIAVVVWSILPESIETGETQPALAEPEIPLSATPPVLSAEAPAAATAPVAGTAPQIAPLGSTPVRPPVAILAALEAEPSAQPRLPDPVGPLPVAADPPSQLPALLAGPGDPALEVVSHPPPRTWPGSVSLPSFASLSPDRSAEPGTPPPFVLPPPVVAEVPQDASEVSEPTDAPAPETELAALAGSDLTVPPEPDASEADIADVTPEGVDTDALSETGGDPLETDIAAAPEPEVLPEATIAEATEIPTTDPLPAPTDFAQTLPDTQPRPRPGDFVAEIERQQFGGRTRDELADIQPPPRPASAQRVAQAERGSAEPSALAVQATSAPRGRPGDIDAIVASVQVARRQAEAAAVQAPDTSSAVRTALADTDLEPEDEPTTNPRNSPRLAIPSDANVARRATIEDAMPLNRINLVGVYGLPSDRRALVRLSSGRYVKVKVGDRIDGGTVAAIGDSALQYRKGGRTIRLEMPQG